jgi:hypothetical protein
MNIDISLSQGKFSKPVFYGDVVFAPLYEVHISHLVRIIRSFNNVSDFFDRDNRHNRFFVDRIYPIEPEIKDTSDTARSASYLDQHLEIDSEDRLRTKLYGKRDNFNFPIVNVPLFGPFPIHDLSPVCD